MVGFLFSPPPLSPLGIPGITPDHKKYFLNDIVISSKRYPIKNASV